jgi:DNA-binding LytR/AlgR family response regulator
MKDIITKLPPAVFFRIHKQFTVNMKYVSHMQYYLGGRYLLYLKDKEEDILPVGITYIKPLKATLGI